MILWFLGLFIEENQLTISLHDLHLDIMDNTNVELQHCNATTEFSNKYFN